MIVMKRLRPKKWTARAMAHYAADAAVAAALANIDADGDGQVSQVERELASRVAWTGGGMRAENEARAKGLGAGAGKTGGVIYAGNMTSAMDSGVTRDADGIDRVKDPPKALLPTLFALRRSCETEQKDLTKVFELGGGSPFGTMAPTKFTSALVTNFGRMHFTPEQLSLITTAYGCGYETPHEHSKQRSMPFESIAWKDFCEDVAKAVDTGPLTVGLASGGSFVPRRRNGSPTRR